MKINEVFDELAEICKKIEQWLEEQYDWNIEEQENHREIFAECLAFKIEAVLIRFLPQFWYTKLREWYTQLSADNFFIFAYSPDNGALCCTLKLAPRVGLI